MLNVNFPWVILVFSFLVCLLLIIYLYFLTKSKSDIKKIMVLGKKDNLDFLIKKYTVVDSLIDKPNLIMDFSNNLSLVKQLLPLNIPILLISNFSPNEVKEIVKLAKYYYTTIIINADLKYFEKDLERIKKGHVIKIYQ